MRSNISLRLLLFSKSIYRQLAHNLFYATVEQMDPKPSAKSATEESEEAYTGRSCVL